MDKALFTNAPQSDLSTVSTNEHEHYLAEIKRIRNEIAGFRPIDTTVEATSNGKKAPPKVGVKPLSSKVRNTTNIKSGTLGAKRTGYY